MVPPLALLKSVKVIGNPEHPGELLLNAANLALVAVGRFQGLPDHQVAVFFVISVAAAEVSLGLAILVAIFRIRKTTAADQLASLRF